MACGSTTNLGRAVAAELGLMARTGYGPAALKAATPTACACVEIGCASTSAGGAGPWADRAHLVPATADPGETVDGLVTGLPATPVP